MKAAFVFNAGGLGDSVMTLPVVQTLKSMASELYIFTHSPIYEVVFGNQQNIKYIYTNDLCYTKINDFPQVNVYFDLAVNGVISRRSMVQFFRFIKAKRKVFFVKLSSHIYLLYPYLRIFRDNIGFYELQKHLIDSITKRDVEWIYPRLECPQETFYRLNEVMKDRLDKTKKTIFINPFVRGRVRNLPTEFYVELIKLLLPDFNVILVGGPDAVEAERELTKYFRENELFSVVGKLNLKEFICFLNLGEILITPDSGPMHLALLSNVCVVPIFTVIRPQYRIPPYYTRRVKSLCIPEILREDISDLLEYLPKGSHYAEREIQKAEIFYREFIRRFDKFKDKILQEVLERIESLAKTCAE